MKCYEVTFFKKETQIINFDDPNSIHQYVEELRKRMPGDLFVHSVKEIEIDTIKPLPLTPFD